MWKVTKEPAVNHEALKLTDAIVTQLQRVTKDMDVEKIQFCGKCNGYSKGQLKDMVRIARLQLQKFANDLDREREWIDEVNN